ncbi:MAG: SDR family oxidoreductase [Alphaproteobacteria bacterium]|nr:SDR family oxidoreductase [Alphaproteobacteria bacterium]
MPAPTHTDTQPLAGRHAVVTGASRGIGAAVARELARRGCALTLIARKAEPLEALAAELTRAGATARAVAADLTHEHESADAFARAAELGGAPSILVNNAGGAESAPFTRTDPALFARMIELNLTSAYLATRAVVPAMVKAGWGRIVNVASTAGLKGYPYVSAYVTAKHGLIGLTRALALEFAKTGVTVNAVCPGYTDTPMLDHSAEIVAAKTKRDTASIKTDFAASNPMGRLVAPAEVAAAVAFLCLPEAASVTGAALPVAGGEI